MQRRVVITGMGVVSPLGCDLDGFWQGLIGGTSGVTLLDRFDASAFTTRIAAQVKDFDADRFVPPKEQRRMDRNCRYALAASRMAVEDAGIDLAKLPPERGGVAIGSGVGGLETLEDQAEVLRTKGPRRLSPFTVPSMIVNMGAGLVAIQHNLQGPNFAVITACATGLHSIGLAARSIRDGECDVMIAGGAEACITPLGLGSFASMRAISTRNDDPAGASRPFDRERDGFVMGEGSGILFLEDYEHAKTRGANIYAEVAGFGMTCDAYHMTAPREDGEGAMRAMLKALEHAGLNVEDVNYINAHGTSTPLNDKVETMAIKRAFGPERAGRLMISSTKSMTGHMLGAAGGIESIVCALAVKHGVVPPTINYSTPDPECDLDYVPNQPREASLAVCLNNSLGFGGHNGCLAFKRV